MADAGDINIRVNIDVQDTFNAADRLDTSLDQIERSANRTDRTFSNLNTTMTTVAKSIAGVIGTGAIINEFKKATKVGIEFNATIAQLGSLTGLVGPELDIIADKAKKIGSTTTLSASQAADAMGLIGAQVPELLKSADALSKVTEATVVLAEASGSTMADAADIMTGVMNQFNLTAEDSDRIINSLAAGAANGAAGVDLMAQTLARGGTAAAQSNLSIEDTIALTQALAKGQINGAEAGTAIRNVLLKLESQMNQGLRPSVVGMSKALENLEKETKNGLDTTKLFGIVNKTAADILIKNRSVYDDVSEAVTGTNEAYKQQSIINNTLKADIASMGSAYEGLQLIISELTDGELRSFVQQITSMLSYLGESTDGITNLEKAFDMAGTAAMATGAVIAGRYVTSLVAKLKATHLARIATNDAIIADNRAAQAALNAAAAEKSAAAANLDRARALLAATTGTNSMTAAQNRVTIATARSVAANANYNRSLAVVAAGARTTSVAVHGLKTAMSFLGGPLGIALLAATAIYSFSDSVKEMKREVGDTSEPLEGLIERLKKVDGVARETELNELRLDIIALREELGKDIGEQFNATMKNLGKDSFTIFLAQANGAKDDIEQISIDMKNAFEGLTSNAEVDFDSLIKSIVDTESISAGLRGELLSVVNAMKTQKEQLNSLELKYIDASRAVELMGDATSGAVENIDSLTESLSAGEIKAKEYAESMIRSIEDSTDTTHLMRLNREMARNEELWGGTSERMQQYRQDAINAAMAADAHDESLKRLNESIRESEREEENRRNGLEASKNAIQELKEQIELTTLSGHELHLAQARLSMGEYATEEQVAEVVRLQEALKAAREEASKMDALEQEVEAKRANSEEGLEAEFELEQERLDRLFEMGRISEEEMNEMKLSKQQELQNRILDINKEAFREQSTLHAALMDSFDIIADKAAGSMTDFIMGNKSAKEAVLDLGKSIVSEFIGSLIKANVQLAVNSMIEKKFAASSAATAAATGASISASMGPAAAAASVATFGGAATAGMAAMAATIPAMIGMFMGGGRFYGGGVEGGGMYRVNEGGEPEVLNMPGNKQYLIPNGKGEVVSNKDATSGQSNGSGQSPIINIYEDASKAGTTNINSDNSVDVFVSNIMSEGDAFSAISSKFGIDSKGV